MVYKSVKAVEGNGSGGYVVSILVNGQVLEERADGQVILPFETEYQIRLRNKTKKDCVAKVYIDDDCVVPEGLIIRKHNFVDLDRPTTKPTKFKFVAVDSFDAVDAGKDRENDPAMGVIRVEFYPEKEVPPTPIVLREKEYIPYTPYPGPFIPPYWPEEPWVRPRRISPRWGDINVSCGLGLAEEAQARIYSHNASLAVDKVGIEAGATIDGGYSNQTFRTGWIDVDWSNCVVLRVVLKGYWAGDTPTPQKEGTKLSRYCKQCNAKRKRPSAKFCELCGTKFDDPLMVTKR